MLKKLFAFSQDALGVIKVIKAGQLLHRLSVTLAPVQSDPSGGRAGGREPGSQGARRITGTRHLVYSVEAKYFNRTG